MANITNIFTLRAAILKARPERNAYDAIDLAAARHRVGLDVLFFAVANGRLASYEYADAVNEPVAS